VSDDAPAGDDHQTEPPLDSAADRFFAAALHRIRRISIVLGAVATVAVWWRFGIAIGLGFVLGAVVSYVNFLWLEHAINAVAVRVSEGHHHGSARGVVFRFLLRYGLVALGCFAILISFKSSIYGFLGGLFLMVAAILCEAAYETVVSLRRGV
jgi:small-conductance mechanosensitive channel